VKSYLRNLVWAVAGICFIAMASGLTLRLHLAGDEDPHHHDSTHCTLCQTMLAGAAQLHLKPHSAVVWTADIVLSIPKIGMVLPRRITPVVLGPRAPPLGTV